MKTKILGILILSIFSLSLVSGVNATDNCIPIEIEEEWGAICPGEEFDITLRGNPSTGYTWKADYDPQYIELVDQTYIPNKPYLCGSGGTYIFTFKALDTGNTDIDMQYLRPWEYYLPAKEIVYHLEITNDILDFK